MHDADAAARLSGGGFFCFWGAWELAGFEPFDGYAGFECPFAQVELAWLGVAVDVVADGVGGNFQHFCHVQVCHACDVERLCESVSEAELKLVSEAFCCVLHASIFAQAYASFNT